MFPLLFPPVYAGGWASRPPPPPPFWEDPSGCGKRVDAVVRQHGADSSAPSRAESRELPLELCWDSKEKTRRKGKKTPLEVSALRGRKLPADGEQRDVFLSLDLSGSPSASLLSFPLKVILLVGASVRPCPRGGPGMVMCSASRSPWPLASAPVGGEDPSTRGPQAELGVSVRAASLHRRAEACLHGPVRGSAPHVPCQMASAPPVLPHALPTPPPTRVPASAHPCALAKLVL